MASFYGNIKNNSRSSFIFDKIYPSRTAMENALNSTEGDGIFVNRYVLIDYGANIAYIEGNEQDTDDNNNQVYYNRYELNPATSNQTRMENNIYSTNRLDDAGAYHAEYDQTVWMKIYTNNKEKYIMVARLKAEAPAFELVSCAPIDDNNYGPHFDLYNSTDINYKYHVPDNWQIALNTYIPPINNYSTTTNSAYYLYERHITTTKTYHIEHEYPYFNKAGFDAKIQHSITGTEAINEIKLVNASSGKLYPKHIYKEYQITENEYIPNRYYIKNGDQYVLATGEYSNTAIYYIQTADSGTEMQNNVKRLDIHIPAIGNVASDAYDMLYGKPRIGLQTTEDEIEQYSTSSTNEAYIKCNIKEIENTSNTIERYLTIEQYKKLPITSGTYAVYPLELYRPYTQTDIYNFTKNNIEPYQNIDPNEPVSVAWALDQLKKYISELRFLSNGEGIVGYTNQSKLNNYIASPDGSFVIYANIANAQSNQGGSSYFLTAEQIEELQPYDAINYPMPVYRKRGLQSDWNLDNGTSFGYIYNKPKILWSNDNAHTNNLNEIYTNNSIETIYDNINIVYSRKQDVMTSDTVFEPQDIPSDNEGIIIDDIPDYETQAAQQDEELDFEMAPAPEAPEDPGDEPIPPPEEPEEIP